MATEPNTALTHDRLTRDVWLWQRQDGHRFSSDDTMTAFVAVQTCPTAKRVADLGCGIGSVLLHVAWALPHSTLVGIEAQAASYELLVRNVAESGMATRITTTQGDLRELTTVESPSHLHRAFDLVTATPPYFPPGTALDAADTQRAYARIEYRGGVEAYMDAAARLLADHGTLVMCGDSRAQPRVIAHAAVCGLFLQATHEVLARADRTAPLFTVWTLTRHTAAHRHTRVALRDVDGAQTDAARALRHFAGL